MASSSLGFLAAKNVNMKGADRISGLPDSILSHILSFLSTEEAVQTSVLSKRWRNLFTLVSNLNFEFDEKHIHWRKRYKSSTVRTFMCFVDRVLFFHAANVDKFRLKCEKRVDSDRIYGWISAAIRRGVKHLDLNITLDKFTFPGALFSCRTLVSLKLETSFVLDVPKGVHFPNLETLQLYRVEFSNDDSVKNLFSSCTSLADVAICSCNMKNISSFNISHHSLKRLTIFYSFDGSNCWFRIDTPNLAYFTYHGHRVAGYSLENLESIVKADIQFSNKYDDNQADMTSFFQGVSMATSLSLCATSLKLLLSCEPLPVFPEMLELRIDDLVIDELYWSNSMNKGLETLLSRTPKLEDLSFNEELLLSLPEQVPSCLLFNLKYVEILDFEDYHDCIRKAKYILKNGGSLKNFTVRTDDKELRLEISKVLLAFPRKSNHCNLLVTALT